MIVLLLACVKSAPAASPADPMAEMVHALSIKDPAPTCESVEAIAPDPVPLMLRVVDEVARPPWVAMRAADCLVERHGPEIAPQMKAWMGDDARKGLGLLTLDHLDDMEPTLAFDVATAALAGPYADAAVPRIARTKHEAVKALAAPTTP